MAFMQQILACVEVTTSLLRNQYVPSAHFVPGILRWNSSGIRVAFMKKSILPEKLSISQRQRNRISRHLLESDPARPNFPRARFFRKKGGGGVFFAGIASYVVDGVDVGRWLPVCFCALLRHFSRRFGEGRAARAKARTGLAFVVSHPCLKNRGTARMGHPAVATIFRKFSCMVVPSGRLLLLCAFGG